MRLINPVSSLLISAAVSMVAPLSMAQTPAADQGFAIVTKDDVPLRAGAAILYYPVANLKAGTVVKIDREEGGFLRVSYPPGLKAYVRADEVSVDAAGRVAKLVRPSRLKAANMAAGDRGSYYPLLEVDLEPGAELVIIESVKADDGKVTAYAVTPPVTARGYLNKEWAKKATAEEAAAAQKASPAAPTGATGATGATGVSGTTAASGATSPGTIQGFTPTGTQAAPAAAPTAAPAPAPASVLTPPPPPKPSPVDSLMATYNKVRAQPLETAELEPTINEFNGYIATLSDSPTDRRTAQYLGNIVEVLKIRVELRNSMRDSAKTDKELDAKSKEVAKQIAHLQAVYTVVGRLVPSTVYDGNRLPKLYRVMSLEPGSGRTLGYLAPTPELDLDGKINRVVGIQCESQMNPALQANMLYPTRVDVLSISAGDSTFIDNPPSAQ